VQRAIASNTSISGRTSPAAGSATFYRYRGADGRFVIVDSLDNVPVSERAKVERVDLDGAAERARHTVAMNGSAAPALAVDWPSFAGGFGVALTMVALFLAVMRGSVRWLAGLLLAGFAVAGAGAYFGWLHRTNGHTDSVFASPAALIDDARSAVDKMKQRQIEQDRVIRDVERQAP
jgi:hypothetical protein